MTIISLVFRSTTTLRAQHYPRLSFRSFHSPFSPSASSSPSSNNNHSTIYEKQLDHSPQPTTSDSGTQTYVVSEPDPSDKYYEVPSGAYSTTTPYQTFDTVAHDGIQHKQMSSMSSSLAHPTLSQRVPYNERGDGMMDKEGTNVGKGGTLADRNPGPTHSDAVVERNSRLGVMDAWKERK
jgi:hypothetical protein